MSEAELKIVETPEQQLATNPESELVIHVTHWTNDLFSFSVTRSSSFRFRSGEFVMIGLPDESGKPILRAYSIASPSWSDELEFYSIKVKDGPLTSRLQKIKAGDRIIVKSKSVGTLVLDALLPGKTLWLLATGTGVAPFASLIRDPEVYEKFDKVILTHTCREKAQLAYGETLYQNACEDPLVGDEIRQKLTYYPTTTREDSTVVGRITDLIDNQQLFKDLKQPAFNSEYDRVMICGSLEMNKDVAERCESAGLVEGSNSAPGHYVVEKAFTEK
ncbi:MAG: ferredoxin--NADP reductase [Granulosicoccus sp.]|nr:ferredoxin--NADP reductase [Granulosicoccus sp.]